MIDKKEAADAAGSQPLAAANAAAFAFELISRINRSKDVGTSSSPWGNPRFFGQDASPHSCCADPELGDAYIVSRVPGPSPVVTGQSATRLTP